MWRRYEPGDDDDLNEDRYVLQDHYLELTRTVLPAEARRNGWRLQDDHCFMRVILDHLFHDCWYNHLDRRLVAYKQLNKRQLQEAIALAQEIVIRGDSLLGEMNARSLAWRRRKSLPNKHG